MIQRMEMAQMTEDRSARIKARRSVILTEASRCLDTIKENEKTHLRWMEYHGSHP